MERFAKQAAEALNQVLESAVNASDLEIPPDPNLGDFAFPCFKLAKQMRASPPEIAKKIVQDLRAKNAVSSDLEVQAAGPYVNFIVPAALSLRALLEDLLKGEDLGQYGQLKPESQGTWVLEYSSPNVAKPFQIYHLRPTALGAALDRIGRFRGYRVVSINHLGDWGTQYGKLAVALEVFKKDVSAPLTMKELVDLYVKIHAEASADTSLEDRAREAFRKLEQNDPEMLKLWKKCVDISMQEFNRIYDRLGIRFDHIWGESHYREMLAPLVQRLRDQGLLVESDGAWVVPVTDEKGKELPPCILIKSDGATIYATRDVAAAIYRYDRFHFDRMTYIVGAEQRLHFQQVFAVLKKMGMDWYSRCEHVPTGLYRFKDAKMSTRKGNFVTLEDVLELAKERVTSLIRERTQKVASHFTPQEIESISEAVAIGAVVFNDLHTDPARDVEFDVDRVVDFEGETGPYLQYAHTRCLSVLRKARESGELSGTVTYDPRAVDSLTAPAEIALVKTLGQLPLHLERTLRFSKASQLAHYLIDVTRAFGTFYRECHVLGQGDPITPARLMLVEATRRVLARGLGLLGVPLPSKM